jgi:hypothetical protein
MRAVLLLALAAAAPVSAQRPRQAQVQSNQPGRVDTGSRARLEGELRRGFARIARDRVGLSDRQMRSLIPVTQRYERERRALLAQEGNARRELRRLMQNEQTADPKLIEQYLAQLVEVQKRRAESLESEQRDLAAIMTPVQRVKYMAIQEQMRRRLEQLRQRRNAIDGEPPPAPPAQRPPLD